MKFKDMVQGTVERDLTQMLIERGVILEDSIDTLLQKEFGSDFYKSVDNRQQELNKLEILLDQSEAELRNRLKDYFFDNNSVIDDIIYHLNTGENINNIASLLDLNNQQKMYLQDMNKSISIYQNRYQNFKEQFINNVKFINEIGETIRGDKQFYTIGIQSQKGPLRNIILKSDQWYQLISQDKIFVLQKMSDGKRALVTNRQWTGETKQALNADGTIKIDPRTGKPIKEHIYSKTRGINAGELAQSIMHIISPDIDYTRNQALSAMEVDPISQEIWNALRGSEIYTQQSIKKYFKTDNEDVLSQIFSARKYEILNSGIWDSVYNEGDAKIRNLKINNIITTIQRQGFDMENIFGGARGDTMLQILNNYVSSQQKFFGNVGKREGFQVIDSTALNNSFNFYKNQENILKADQQAIEQLAKNPQISQQIQQQGLLAYKTSANNLFLQFFGAIIGSPNVTINESGDFDNTEIINAIFS